MKPFDISPYIGVPFLEHGRDPNGWDCWGSFYYLRKVGGEPVPCYSGRYDDVRDREQLDHLISNEMSPWEKIEIYQAGFGDGVLLKIENLPVHIGFYLGNKQFLHVHAGIETTVERLDSLFWKRRVEGLYRQRDVASNENPQRYRGEA